MTTPRLNVERELGVISTTLTQIQKDMEEAKAGHLIIATSLQASVRVQEQLQRGGNEQMASVKPAVDELSRWKLIGLGAVMAVGAIGTMIGLTLATARDWFLQTFWGP